MHYFQLFSQKWKYSRKTFIYIMKQMYIRLYNTCNNEVTINKNNKQNAKLYINNQRSNKHVKLKGIREISDDSLIHS
jgi:hypothetical protein